MTESNYQILSRSGRAFWDGIIHFEPEEFVKDPNKAAPCLVLAMDTLRELVGRPIYIHACWAESGHAEHSFHNTGQAVDFRFSPGLSILEQFVAVTSIPQLMGIGFYPYWQPCPGWHVDIRGTQRRLYWYRGKHEYHYGFKQIAKALGGQYA